MNKSIYYSLLAAAFVAAAPGMGGGQLRAEEYYREAGGGTATAVSHSGRYITGSDEDTGFWMGPSRVFGFNSYLWDSQTGEKVFSTSCGYENMEEGGCFLGVNDSGTVVGYYKDPQYKISAIAGGEIGTEPVNCAAYWENGELHSLGIGNVDLQKCKKFTDGTQAIAISDDGNIIVGTATMASRSIPCRWVKLPDGSWHFEELPVPAEEGVTVWSTATTGVSADGSVISGYVSIAGEGSAAVFWIDGKLYPIPLMVSDARDPNATGLLNQAVSVSANGKYIGVYFDQNMPAVYSLEEGRYTLLEFSQDIKVNTVKHLGVNDNGDAVCYLNIANSSAREDNLIYKRETGCTYTFDYYSKVFAPSVDLRNVELMAISNDGKVFSGAKYGSCWSMGITDEEVEIPAVPKPLKSKIAGLRKVDLTWEAVENTAKTWNVKSYKIYQDGKELATVPYAPYAKDYLYTVEDSPTGNVMYYMTCEYENEAGVTIESPRSDYTSLMVCADYNFPESVSGFDMWNQHYWSKTYQIPYDEVNRCSWGQWEKLFGFTGGPVGTCSVNATVPYSLAVESHPMDATEVTDNIYVCFPRKYIRKEGSTDYSNEFLALEVSTDLGETWTEARTWRGDELNWKWDFDYADITDLAAGKLFQVRLRRYGEGKAQFTTLVDHVTINTEVGKKAEGLTSFDKDDENIELIWKNNAGAYDLNYMGNAFGNALVLAAANEGKPFIGATLYEEDKLKPFDGKYISGITTVLNWYDKATAEDPQIDAKILIWEDDKLVREQEITDKRTNQDYIIPLDEPYLIDASKKVRIGISIDNYPETEIPLLYVNSMTYVPGKSDLYSEDGGKTWSTLEEAWKYAETPDDGIGSWRISANITDTPGLPEGADVDRTLTGFNVYRNGEKINKELVWYMEGRYITPKVDGYSEYKLLPIYKESGIGPMSDGYGFNYSGIEGVEDESGDVTMQKRGENILLQGDYSRAALYTVDGRLVALVSGSEFSTSSLQPGVYLLKVETGKSTRSFKFIR